MMHSVHVRTMLLCAAVAGLSAWATGCAAEPEPCNAAAALKSAPTSIALVEGGRGLLALPRNDGVTLRLDGLLAGFTSRRREDGVLVIAAPYGISGTLPARLQATCDDGDRAARAIELVIDPFVIVPLAPIAAAGPGPRRAPGMAVVDAGVVVVGGHEGSVALADAWLLPRGATQWRPLDVTLDGAGDGALDGALDGTLDGAGVGAGSVQATALGDGRSVLLLGANGATALLEVAGDGQASLRALSPGGAVPLDSDGALPRGREHAVGGGAVF